MYLFFSLNIYLFGKNVRLFCTKTKQNKIKQNNPKPLQVVNSCSNYNDVNLGVSTPRASCGTPVAENRPAPGEGNTKALDGDRLW